MRGWVTTLRKWPGVVRALLWACLEVCTCMSRLNENNERKWIVICYHNGNNKSYCTWNCSEDKVDKDKGFISLDLFLCLVVVNMRMHLGGCRSVVFFCFFLSFFISSLIKCLFVCLFAYLFIYLFGYIGYMADWLDGYLAAFVVGLVSLLDGWWIFMMWYGTVDMLFVLTRFEKKKPMLPYKRE